MAAQQSKRQICPPKAIRMAFHFLSKLKKSVEFRKLRPIIYSDCQNYIPRKASLKSPCPPLKKGERFSPAGAFAVN
jgi:hypothetical protein